MTSDSAVVVILLLGFLYMVGIGTVLNVQDDVRPAVGRLLAGTGAAIGFLLLL